jgi:hypothetical protein
MQLPWRKKKALDREQAIAQAERDFERAPPTSPFAISQTELSQSDDFEFVGTVTVHQELVGPTIDRLDRRIQELQVTVVSLVVLVVLLMGCTLWCMAWMVKHGHSELPHPPAAESAP